MSSFDPFRLFYAVMGGLQNFRRKNFVSKWLRGSSRSRSKRRASPGIFAFAGKLKKTFVYRWTVGALIGISVLPKLIDALFRSWSKKSGANKALAKPVDWIIRLSRTPGVRALVDSVGIIFRWIRTRRWGRIIVASVPTLALCAGAFFSWYGGQIDRGKLASFYNDLGEEELKKWENNLDTQHWLQSDSVDALVAASTRRGEEGGDDNDAQLASYGEMLFRRVQILRPEERVKVWVARSMLARGAFDKGRKLLLKLAPDDAKGNNQLAHEVMAAGCLVEYHKTHDASLLHLIQHHADAGFPWRYSHPLILRFVGDLCWQNGDEVKALQYLEAAARRTPEANIVLAQRAKEAGQNRMARSARDRGISYFQSVLKRKPNDAMATIYLAVLLSEHESGLDQAENILRNAIKSRPNSYFARALSEVHRKRFLSTLKSDPKTAASALHKAIVLDPTNSLIADEISKLMSEDAEGVSELVDQLNGLLVSGQETTGIHAMLAEYHHNKRHEDQAILHLEQVYQAVPIAVKFANDLASAYASHSNPERRNLDKALAIALKSKAMLEQTHRLSERRVDDLLETIGKIYEEQKRYPEAIEAYMKCVELNPSRADVRRRLAGTYRLRNNSKENDAESAKLQESLADRIDQNDQELTAYKQLAARKQKVRLNENATPSDLAEGEQNRSTPEKIDTSEDLPTSPAVEPESDGR